MNWTSRALNCGSGQRPFGLPRPEVVPHNLACAICGVSRELHSATYPAAMLGTISVPHNYIPYVEPFAWINIDINPKWIPDLVADWNNLDMFSDASVDYVVSHHSLEHLNCGMGEGCIKEAWRVLKPEGSLIVSVPHMRKLAVLWLSGELTTQIYMTNVYGAYMGNEEDIHRWGFDLISLEGQLKVAPWRFVREFDFRPIPGADIARDDRWILCLEAVK